MGNELMVKYKWQDKDITLTKSDVRNLISTDPKVTDKEIALFMQLCKYQSLNPFVREAYLIKYGTYPASMVVGKEVFTKRAEQNPDFDGYEITDNYIAGMDLSKFEVTCNIFRKNIKHAIIVTVNYTEYVGTDSKGNVNRMWKSKPRTMLRKVSLMQGLREAFPTALGGLYEEHELDQRAEPKDITPKGKVASMPFDPQREGQVTKNEEKIIDKVLDEQEVDRNNEAIEEAEVIEEEKAKEQAEMEFEPASDKQKDFIYGVGKKKGIIHSHLITDKEIERIGKNSDLSKEKASKILLWWWGDKDKNIIGEREKREKNPKTGESDLERRSTLMREVLALMKKNYIHKPMQKKFYKKFQKSDIKELTTEELVTLKGELEHYVPDWK